MKINRLSSSFFGVGLLLLFIGFALLMNGPSKNLRFEQEYLGTWSSSISSQECKELFWYYTGTFHAYSEYLNLSLRSNISDAGTLLHIVNDSEYESWETQKVLTETLVSTNLTDAKAINYEIREETKYHFLMENTLNHTVSLSLYAELSGLFLRYDYTYALLPYIIAAAGTVLLIVFRKDFFSRMDTFLGNWSLPKPETVLEWKLGQAQKSTLLKGYSDSKRLARYCILAFACIMLIYLCWDLIQLFQLVLWWSPPRPEYTLVVIDLVARINIARALMVTPLAAGFVFYLLFLSPRIGDICRIVQTRVGIHDRTEKQWRISQSMYQHVKDRCFSKRFLILPLAMFLPLALLILLDIWNVAFLPIFAAESAMLGIVCGSIIWSSFQEACSSNNIGKFASRTFMKASSVELVVRSFLTLVFFALVVLFGSSGLWLGTLRQSIVEPVLMLNGWPESTFSRQQDFAYIQTIFVVSIPFIILILLFLVLFPYIYRVGRNKLTVAFITFWLTFFTERGVSTVLGESGLGIPQPIAFLSPLLAAIVSWVVQEKYKKIIGKQLRASRS